MIRPQKNIELKKYTTSGVGGPAKYFFKATSTEKLIKAVNFATTKKLLCQAKVLIMLLIRFCIKNINAVSNIKAEIITQKKDSTIVIPKSIIVSRQRGKTVFVIDQNTAMERVITTGLENPDSVEIIKGIQMNDRVVIEGFETLGNRSKVKIVR